MNTNERMADAIARLDLWLESMRQEEGYAGPVAHYWQNRLGYGGPGLDWRYEGLLCGYHTLYVKTGDERWRLRANRAAEDLHRGQGADGLYRASRFEINPGTLGTPHEAAASLGLLESLPTLTQPGRYLRVAKTNLDAVIDALWDGQGFNDHRTVKGRVPNKLATLAQALLHLAEHLGRAAGEPYLRLARNALDDVLKYQEPGGAVHQYAPGAGAGDGRFFPFYNARCVEPLLLGEKRLEDPRYGDAARRILDRLAAWENPDGSWPQIVYQSGRRAEYPRWFAGGADLLYAFHVAGKPVPAKALDRLLNAQLPSGAFPTAEGFAAQVNQRLSASDPRDLLGVVGWNDKVLRLLARMLPNEIPIPPGVSEAFHRPVVWLGKTATYTEASLAVQIVSSSGETLYHWNKRDVWAEQTFDAAELR